MPMLSRTCKYALFSQQSENDNFFMHPRETDGNFIKISRSVEIYHSIYCREMLVVPKYCCKIFYIKGDHRDKELIIGRKVYDKLNQIYDK